MLRIASRVPDHKKLAPWRFIVIEGDARAKLGDVIADACIGRGDGAAVRACGLRWSGGGCSEPRSSSPSSRA